MLLTGIMTLVLGLAMLNFPIAISSDLSWTDDRYDLLNTGYVDGTGGLQAMVESYRLHEERSITSIPVSIDLDGDGVSEVVYPIEGGDLVIRRGFDGGLVERINFGGNISGSPVVFDHRSDGAVDLVVLVATTTGTSVHLVRGSDLISFKKLVLPGNHSRGEGSISDVDEDDHPELVFSTYEGYIYAVDLTDFSVDWVTLTGSYMAGSVAIYNGSGGPRIAVTSDLSYGQWGELGNETLYVLNGSNGDIEWSFKGHGTISTPPTVVREEPSAWIAFGTYVGNIYVVDVEAERTVLEIDRKEFDEPPYWSQIDLLDDDGSGSGHLVLFGKRAIAVLCVSDRSIVWGEFQPYPVTLTDSLVCDIDDDGDVELVVVNESRIMPHSSFLRFIDPTDGTDEITVTGLPRDPVGLIIADIDDDGSLELLLCFNEWLLSLNEEPYIDVKGIFPSNGSVYKEGHPIEFEVLYTYRDTSQVPVFVWTSDIQGTIGTEAGFVSEQLMIGNHVITVTIDDRHGHLIISTLELDVVSDGGTSWIILLVILIVVALVVVWYWRNRQQ